MKEAKTTLERIRSAGKALAALLKIMRICCFVGIGFLAAGIVYVMLWGDIDLLVLGGRVVLHSPFNAVTIAGMDNWQIIFRCFAGIASLALLSALFRLGRELFLDLSIDNTPFAPKQAGRIRKIAVFYLIVSLLDFQSGAAPFSFTLNLVGIVGALMLWCISLIFEYGCELQKEADETL